MGDNDNMVRWSKRQRVGNCLIRRFKTQKELVSWAKTEKAEFDRYRRTIVDVVVKAIAGYIT